MPRHLERKERRPEPKEAVTMKKHIVSFSGGKDSTAMLLMMIDKGMQIGVMQR